MTDSSGQETQQLVYLPFGEDWVNQTYNAPQYETPYKFNGKEKDEETGYNNYGARYYTDKLSIFLSVDPLSDKYPHLTSYNYCSNNPIMLVDPDGKEGVGVVKNNTITVNAIYYVVTGPVNNSANTSSFSYLYSKKDVANMQKSINETLNKANYKVTKGEYAGYDVKFDLQFVPSDKSNYEDLAKNAEYKDIPIGNTFEKSLPEINTHLKKEKQVL